MQDGQIKAPEHKFTLLCDDIRQEVGGKVSIIGLYDHHIVVPHVPYILPKICFYIRFSSMYGSFKFNFSIISPDNNCKDIVLNNDIEVPQQAKESTFTVVASPFEVNQPGIYEVIIGLTKNIDKFEYIYKFAITDNSISQPNTMR